MKTHPRHVLDYLLWPILQWVWEPFSKKHSHFWHWRSYRKEVTQCKPVAGDLKAKSRNTWWSMLYQTNFGWKSVVIFRAKGPFQVGFVCPNEGKCQLCSIVLSEVVAVLVGPEDVSFFAVDLEGNEIPLEFMQETSKWTLPDNVVLV